MPTNIIAVKQVRKKNLLTIPKEVIDFLQLEEGDHIRFDKENGDIIIRKL